MTFQNAKMIWDYEFNDRQPIKMLTGAKIRTAEIQDGALCLWVDLDDEGKKVSRRNMEHLTVRPMESMDWPWNAQKGKYVATFHDADGILTFHIFECDAP